MNKQSITMAWPGFFQPSALLALFVSGAAIGAPTQAQVKPSASLYFAFMSWQRSVRDKRYKLIEYCVGKERHTQLFDLANDPQETRNLAGDDAHPVTLARLRKLLQGERVRLNDGNTPFLFSNQQSKDFWSAYDFADK